MTWGSRHRRGAGPGRQKLVAVAVTVSVASGLALAMGAGAVQVGQDSPITPPNGLYNQGLIARDPTNPTHLAVTYFNQNIGDDGTCYLALSTDNGQTWTSQALAGTGTAYPLPTGGFTRCFFATPKYGPDGTLYVVFSFAYPNFGYSQVYMLVSHDNGATWGPLRTLDPDSTITTNKAGDLQAAIAVGPKPGEVYVAFNRYGMAYEIGDIMFVASTDGGQTFSAPMAVSPTTGPSAEYDYDRPFVAVDSAGTIYVSWANENNSFSSTPSTPFEVASSTDGGQTFSAPHTIVTAANPGNTAWIPIATGPTPGTLYATWNDVSSSTGLTRMYFAVSHDGGTTWSSPLELGVPAGASADNLFWPQISVAPSGRIDVVFSDQAPDTINGFANFDLTYSSDGGSTFSSPIQLSSAPSFTQFKAYNASVAVASSDTSAGVVWTDTRRGSAATPAEDVFFGSVNFPAPTIAIAAPANGATYTQGQALNASYSCTAAGGDTIKTCSGTLANGAAVSTQALGTHTFTVSSSTYDGPTASQTATYTVAAPKPAPPPAPTAPTLTRVSQSASRWAETKAGSRRHKAPIGTTFRFTLNQPAKVTLAFTEKRPGHKVGGRCVTATRRNRHKPKCTLSVGAGRLTVAARQGANTVRFAGRLSGTRKLKPGRYTVTFTAVNSHGQRSRPHTLSFTIVK